MKKLKDGIIGLAVGDALGLPVEFKSREELQENPLTDMRGYGTYHQPKGTWSDDTSLTLCLLDALNRGFDLKNIAENFVKWLIDSEFTPHGVVFDVGNTTQYSIVNLRRILYHKTYNELILLRNEDDEQTNGNGSLMRILPLYNEVKTKGVEQEFIKIWNVSALTHQHIRAGIACTLYLILIDEISRENDKNKAYENTQNRMKAFFKNENISESEQSHFRRLVVEDIWLLEMADIKSGGYVMESLEASIWCFLTTNSYKDAVLKAVNLGGDTDTIGAITGGMAGMYYGIENIPAEWKNALVSYDFIEDLCNGQQVECKDKNESNSIGEILKKMLE
ncbi:MAG: ADP-ribosylglycohydrolase family protein [Flavobacteriaceae bacterium]|nr:ADP-ribosylglycohydrolase family protein [Flavobacteriaceae bacterium]